MNGINEPKIEQQIKMKREFGSMPQFDDVRDPRETPSFEHFLMMGIPPDYDGKSKLKPRVLLLYPYFPLKIPENEFDQVLEFAFPNGVQELKLSNGREPSILDEFAFCFTKESGTLYGCCVRFRIVEGLQSFFLGPHNRNYPFCFCMLTREPFFAPHYNFLTYLVKTTVGWESVMMFETKVDLIELPKDAQPVFLENMTKLASFARWKKMGIYKDIILNVQSFYHLRRGDSVKKWRKIRVEYPDQTVSQQESIGCSTLDSLFSHFTIDNIIKIITAVLLEHQVIVLARRPSKCSNIILAIRCLIYPFKLSGGGFMPILPNIPRYLAILASPTPLFLGVLKSPQLDLSVVEEPKCIIDVDDGTVTDKELKLEMYNAFKIRSELTYYLDARLPQIKVPPRYIDSPVLKTRNQEWVDFFSNIGFTSMPAHFTSQIDQKYVFSQEEVRNIIGIFKRNFIVPILDFIRSCIVTETTDPENIVSVFNFELFKMIHEKDDFLLSLVDTIKFQDLVNRLVDEKTLWTDLQSASVDKSKKHSAQKRLKQFQLSEAALD